MELVTLLNTIRDNASTTYQARVPEATRTNIESIRMAMIDDDNVSVANEFTSALMNKIVKVVVHSKLFTNPLKSLKKGTKPIGDTVEEIYTNFLKGGAFDNTGANLLSRNLPDVKAVYHRMNYKQQYKVTISYEALSKAFMSYGALETFISNIYNTLYNSAELDEYLNTKEMLKSAISLGAVKMLSVVNPNLSDTNGKKFIKTVKTISGLMVFPSEDFNGYLSVQDSDDLPITTFSRKNEQVLILDTETDTSVSVDVLASLFNMSVAEFNDTAKIVIDMFPNVTVGTTQHETKAMLVDKAFFQIYDDLFNVTSFNNPEGLYTNYYLNVWQTLAFSPLVNAVGFSVQSAVSEGEEVTP